MKNYLLGMIFFLISANFAFSGPIELFNQMDTVRGSILDDELVAYAQVRNLTFSNVEFQIKFEFLKKVEEHSAAVCWDICYAFTDKPFTAPVTVGLEAQAESPLFTFSGHLQSFKLLSEDPITYSEQATGETIVRYIFAPVGGTVEDEIHYDVVFIVTDPASVNEVFADFGVNVFPNPSSDYINISFDSAPNSESLVSIYDLQGNNLGDYKIEANNTNKMININNLPAGSYYLKMKNDGKYGAKLFNVVR